MNLTDIEKETLLLLADNSLNVSKVADETYYSRKAIYERVRNIRAKTGINPLDFWGLNRLLSIVENEKEEKVEQRRTD